MKYKDHITGKFWRGTLRKLRMISALSGKSMVEILDKLISEELKRAKEKYETYDED